MRSGFTDPSRAGAPAGALVRGAASPDALALLLTLRAAIVDKGWSETARLSGVDRTVLHRAFPKDMSRRFPHFVTVCLVAQALGFRLGLEPQP